MGGLGSGHNFSDQTHAVVEDFCRRHPGGFRYLFEPLQGKSHALNAGIREARGDIVAFTDDDVTVKPTWLENLTSALHDGEWAGAGGCVLPERSFAPPPWLPVDADYASGPLALFNPGSGVGQLSELPPSATIWHFERKYSTGTEVFEPIWDLARATRFGMRIRSWATACCVRGSDCVTSHQPLFITRCPKTVFRSNTF